MMTSRTPMAPTTLIVAALAEAEHQKLPAGAPASRQTG